MDYHEHLKLASFLSRLMDRQFGLGQFRFGLDPIIGLIPVFGDLVPVGLSVYTIWIAKGLNAPLRIIAQMIKNTVIDVLIGWLPLIGDISDFFYQSHTKNIKLLNDFLDKDTDPRLKRIA